MGSSTCSIRFQYSIVFVSCGAIHSEHLQITFQHSHTAEIILCPINYLHASYFNVSAISLRFLSPSLPVEKSLYPIFFACAVATANGLSTFKVKKVALQFPYNLQSSGNNIHMDKTLYTYGCLNPSN